VNILNGNGEEIFRKILRVVILTFVLSIIFNIFSQVLMRQVGLLFAFLILSVIIGVGVIFDIVGVAVTVAEETPFHAMAAKKIPGGKVAIKLIRNADIVANFCNDIIGDIAGTVSGAAGAAIVLRIILLKPSWDETIVSMIAIGLIAASTVAGKAVGKRFAIEKANEIVAQVGKFLFIIEGMSGIEFLKQRKNPKRHKRR
jgi:hypothetical protein